MQLNNKKQTNQLIQEIFLGLQEPRPSVTRSSGLINMDPEAIETNQVSSSR